jgi:predicted transcriptional regulator
MVVTKISAMHKRYDIPKPLLQKLYFDEKLTQTEIAKMIGCSAHTISMRMHEYGMIARSPRDCRRIELSCDKLYELYIVQGQSAQAIAHLWSCSEATIFDRLAEYEIPIRSKEQVYVPRELLATWSPGLAYAVGLVASDGNLSRRGYGVGLPSSDLDIIRLYLDCLHVSQVRPDIPINEEHPSPPRKTKYSVVFYDQVYYAFLEGLGLTPGKSKTLRPLAIPDDVFRDFLRGDWDGDGSWHLSHPPYNYLRASLSCGSPAFQQWVQTTVERLTGLHGVISGLDLVYNGRKAISLGQWLYYAPGLPALWRKREIWERYIEAYKSPQIAVPYDELYDLYIIQGLSSATIAQLLGCSDDAVLRKLKKYNIPVHSRGGSPKRKQ